MGRRSYWRPSGRGARPGGGEQPETPNGTQTIDRFTASHAAALGWLLSAVNPGGLLLIVGARCGDRHKQVASRAAPEDDWRTDAVRPRP